MAGAEIFANLARWELSFMTDSLQRFPSRLDLEAAGINLGVEYEVLIGELGRRLIAPGNVVIDGGAHKGMHTLSFARLVGPEGLVHAFEPMEDLVAENCRRARTAGVDDSVRYHTLALSDVFGEADFYRHVHKLAQSSLKFRVPGEETTAITVAVDTLDALFPREAVDFIKLDLEGSEFSALKGGAKLIKRSAPFIVFENARHRAAIAFGYKPLDFFTFFERWDALLYDAFGNPFTPERWTSPQVGWYFCAFPRSRFDPTEYQSLVVEFWRGRLEAARAQS